MKEYDVIVIGSGCGLIIVSEALGHEKKVALVDKGPIGGTCPNVGCIPSKMLIHPADRIVEALEAGRVGVKAAVESVDFQFIMERMRSFVQENQAHIRTGLSASKGLDFYEGEGHFVDEYTVEVNGDKLRGKKIFIASGSRPVIPPLRGLDGVDYLTNESVLQLKERPDSMIIIGGGYIAVEYGHFFAAMGTRVTILEMADRLVLSEEPEISRLLQEELQERMEVYTGARVTEVKKSASGVTVVTGGDGVPQEERSAASLLLAVGRRSNADLLKLENTGVEVDERGWVKVNEYLETGKKNVWAVGDIVGRHMFTHVANREAMLAADAAVHGSRPKMDYSAAPHAVYSHPQIASVGITEEAARKDHHKILTGRASYFDVAKGEAMMEKRGFAKAIVDADTEKILGFHIVGPYAPMLIQEVVGAMASGTHIRAIQAGMHIHPAMTELIPSTIASLG